MHRRSNLLTPRFLPSALLRHTLTVYARGVGRRGAWPQLAQARRWSTGRRNSVATLPQRSESMLLSLDLDTHIP